MPNVNEKTLFKMRIYVNNKKYYFCVLYCCCKLHYFYETYELEL